MFFGSNVLSVKAFIEWVWDWSFNGGEKRLARKESRVKNRTGEPLFTIKELLVGAVLCLVYSVTLLSLDPQWVAWAAPMVFGGALYVPDPPPVVLSSPREVLGAASLFSFVSLFALGLLMTIRGEPNFVWLAWLKAGLKNGGLKNLADWNSGREA